MQRTFYCNLTITSFVLFNNNKNTCVGNNKQIFIS